MEVVPEVSESVELVQVHRAGALCLGGGLLGVGEGIVTLSWSPQVPDERFSYPFDEFWFVIAELAYAFQHLLLVAAGLALLWLPAVRASRAARIATRVAVSGLVLLVVAELSALCLYDAEMDSSLTTVITSLFTLPDPADRRRPHGRGSRTASTGCRWRDAGALAARRRSSPGRLRLRGARTDGEPTRPGWPSRYRRLDAALRCRRLRPHP